MFNKNLQCFRTHAEHLDNLIRQTRRFPKIPFPVHETITLHQHPFHPGCRESKTLTGRNNSSKNVKKKTKQKKKPIKYLRPARLLRSDKRHSRPFLSWVRRVSSTAHQGFKSGLRSVSDVFSAADWDHSRRADGDFWCFKSFKLLQLFSRMLFYCEAPFLGELFL